jgi:hypothetical protein
MAALARFHPRDTDFRIHARSGLFKTQRHVVPQIRAALPALAAATSPPATENIFESE